VPKGSRTGRSAATATKSPAIWRAEEASVGLLESAVANAENNHELLEDDLIVREAYQDERPKEDVCAPAVRFMM
jgi:ribosomal protein L22